MKEIFCISFILRVQGCCFSAVQGPPEGGTALHGVTSGTPPPHPLTHYSVPLEPHPARARPVAPAPCGSARERARANSSTEQTADHRAGEGEGDHLRNDIVRRRVGSESAHGEPVPTHQDLLEVPRKWLPLRIGQTFPQQVEDAAVGGAARGGAGVAARPGARAAWRVHGGLGEHGELHPFIRRERRDLLVARGLLLPCHKEGASEVLLGADDMPEQQSQPDGPSSSAAPSLKGLLRMGCGWGGGPNWLQGNARMARPDDANSVWSCTSCSSGGSAASRQQY